MSGNSSRPALFFARFRRITSTNEYLPEIDGLRFISIFLVAFLFHPVGGYIVGDLLHGELPSSPFVNTFIKNGAEGVTFFFIISGFILTLPFARGQMQFGPNNLKKYFLRRLTRIEPPYIISLTLIFLIRLLISGKEPFSWLFPHYLSSLFYLSNVFYNQFPFINGVTWSLEVEIQFYILLPFFSLVYFRLRPFTRRILLCLLALLGVWHLYSQELVLGNIGHHGCHFICGILLADLYVNKKLKP